MRLRLPPRPSGACRIERERLPFTPRGEMRRPTHIRVFLVAAIAAALVCLVGGASAAAVKKASTTSTLVFKSPNNFSGDLSSPNRRCISSRLVTVYYLGPSGMSSPQFIEAAKTDDTGHFEINS